MEQQSEPRPVLTRLVLCVILAAALWAGANQFGEHIPQLSPHLPWLEDHKLAVIAVLAAVLFGGSLLVLPPGPAEVPAEEASPCPGYERTYEEEPEEL